MHGLRILVYIQMQRLRFHMIHYLLQMLQQFMQNQRLPQPTSLLHTQVQRLLLVAEIQVLP